jgi:hypothetical protein
MSTSLAEVLTHSACGRIVRGRLVKDEFPGKRVAVSHGQPRAHWKLVDPGQRLYIDLESMWEDFERSVESLMELLASNDERRAKTLERWRRRQWSVQQVVFTDPKPAGVSSTASVSSTSTSVWHPPESR